MSQALKRSMDFTKMFQFSLFFYVFFPCSVICYARTWGQKQLETLEKRSAVLWACQCGEKSLTASSFTAFRNPDESVWVNGIKFHSGRKKQNWKIRILVSQEISSFYHHQFAIQPHFDFSKTIINHNKSIPWTLSDFFTSCHIEQYNNKYKTNWHKNSYKFKIILLNTIKYWGSESLVPCRIPMRRSKVLLLVL